MDEPGLTPHDRLDPKVLCGSPIPDAEKQDVTADSIRNGFFAKMKPRRLQEVVRTTNLGPVRGICGYQTRLHTVKRPPDPSHKA